MAGYTGKRALDLAIALTALLFLGLPMLFVALAIRLTSRGPIFFRQRRLGLCEKPFFIFKFRSMIADAPQKGPQFTQSNDSRITRVGKFIRRTSLDELPQVFNVLRGDMSIVGPRPYAGFELDQTPEDVRRTRSNLRPGITGLAQVSGRSALTFERSLALDSEYVKIASLWTDIRIIVKTVLPVLRGSGTN